MAQSSRGYNTDPEEDDRADALPLDTQDRASANLKSPAFEKPAVEPEPATPRFATPMASALDEFVPAQSPTAPPDTALQSRASQEDSSPDATAAEQPVQAPRVRGADDPEVGQALQHYGDQPEPILPPRPGSEDAWLKATDERQRQNDQQQAGIHAFLKSRGVETETLPDGSQTIATHPDGAPVWKPTTSAPFQDPDSGQWVVRQRDDHGNLRDVSALDVHGAVHTDAKTGDQYVYDSNRQPVKIGTDQTIAAARAVATTRSFLYARENQAAAQIADLNASLAPVKEQFHAMQAMPATESDALGGTSQSIKQVENTIANLQAGASKDPAVQEQLKSKIEARDKFYQDNPTYSQIQATLAAGKEQVRSIDADRRRDRDTRIQMALGTTSAAVQSTLPDTRATTGQESPAGDADPAEVARTAAIATGNGTPATKALVGALRQMKASGAQTVAGRPIDEAISAAANPPAKPAPPAPEQQAPANSASSFWKNMVGTFMNAADQSGALLGEGVLRAFGATDAADEAGKDARYAKEVASGQFSADNPYRPGGPKEGQDLKGWVDPARKDELMTGIAGAASDVPMFVAGPWAAVPSFTIKGASEAGDEAASQGKSRSMGALKGAGQGVATLAAYAVGGPIAGRLTPAIEGPLARGLATAGISTGVNSIISATMSSVFGGNALPQTPAEWGQRLFMDAGFGLHASIESAKLPGHIASALNVKLTLPEQIQLSQARLEILNEATSAIEAGDAGGAHVTASAEDAAANLKYLNDQKAQVEKFLKAQNPKLVDAIDQKVKAAADAAKTAVDSAPVDPSEAATTNARAFTDTLRKSDILQRKADALPADHPLEDRASLTERQQAGQDALATAHDTATEAVPEVARKAIAATLGAKPEAVQAHFDEQPDAAFQSAHVGKQLRDLYTTPEQRTRLDSVAARVGEHGPTAQFIADQHVGMKAAKDLTAIAALREVAPERVAGLQRLGLVEMENGQPVVTHDALPLLPKGMTARLIGSHDAYRVKSLPGEKLQGAAAMVRAGQGQLEQAMHAKALATRPPAEMATHRVRVEFTNKAGKSGETTFDVKAPSEEHALTQAAAQVESKGTVKVDKAEITTRERERARKNERGSGDSRDPLAPNVATPAKLSDFTPAEQQFANLVVNEYKRNQKYLAALGISKFELVRNSADKSGLAISSEGALQLDASQLKRQADTFSKQGVKAKEWARAALQEEAWHAIQFRAAGADFQTHYADLHSALSPEMMAHAREVYTDFDSLPKHAQAAEVERMILQNKWNGTITEKFVASIERILAYLKGLKIESPLLNESIARVEAVRDEALKRAKEQPEEQRSTPESGETSPAQGAASQSTKAQSAREGGRRPLSSPEAAHTSPKTEAVTPEAAAPSADQAARTQNPEQSRSPDQQSQSDASSPEPAAPAPEAQATTRESLENDPKFDDVSGFFKAAKQGVRADYDGYKGTLQRDEQGRAVIVTDDGQHVEIPPEDQRLGTGAVTLRDPVVEVTKGGKVSLSGKPYEFVRSNIGADGTLESVTVKNAAGREQTVDNPRQAMTIALEVSKSEPMRRVARRDAEEAKAKQEREQGMLFAAKAPDRPAEEDRKYTPALKTADGTIYTGDSHPDAYMKALMEKGSTSGERGYVRKDGSFTSNLMEIARSEGALAASKAKSAKEKEAERIAKLRETRAGFAAEADSTPQQMFMASRGEYAAEQVPPFYVASTEKYARNFGDNVREVTIAPKRTLDLTQVPHDADDGGQQLKAILAKQGIDTAGLNIYRDDELAQALNRNLPELSKRIAAAGFDSARLNEYVEGGGADTTTLIVSDSALPKAEAAPTPHVLTNPEGRSAINAYHHLARTTGFPAVSIADLADQSGVPLERLKQQLLRSQKAGSVVLSTGDWSLASDKQKSGVIEDKGQKMLQVRFLKESGDLAAAKAVAAAHAKVVQAIAPLRDEMKTSGAKREIAQGFDATGNKANERGVQATNHIRLPFELPIPKGETGAQAKAREAAVKQDLVAARPVVEAGGSKARLAAELAKVNASTDAKLKAKFAPIYQYALDNFDRLNRMLAAHTKLANENYDSLKAAGIDVGKRAEYVHRVTTPPEDPNAPHLAFEMGNGSGSGNARGMLKGRSFDTMADAIKAGYDPGTYGLHEADGRMVQNSTRIIGDKAFLDKMKQVKAPTDGKPIIGQLVKRRLANGGTDLKTPDGYAMVQAMGRPLVIHKMFAPLFRDLYGTSAIRNFAAGRALLKLAAAGKHGTLVFDTFHVGRLLYKMAAGGGGSPITIRDGKPAFNYHAGLSLLEYSDKDLAAAVKQGEVTPEEAAYAKKNRGQLDELVKAGLNVGKVADNLMDQVKSTVPGITKMNDWIFGKLSRGAMVQTALAFHERNLARPGMSREQAARRTATEMNEYFGNLQNQGIFKSKTLQDIARLVFLAPNWTESQARYEARAYGQLGASAVDAARGKGLRAGNATRAMATGFVALLAANQITNYLSRGQSTFQNEEDGHKLDAWVPGGKRGFWFNPFEIAGEYAHAAMKYTAQHENPVDVATHIASNKLSPLARGVKEAGTGRDAMGRHFLSDTDRFRSAAVDALPSPLPLGSVFEKDPRAPIGYRMTRANGGILPSMEKQALQSLGAKLTAAQSPRAQMFSLAQPFKPEGVYADSAGEYTALRQALDMDEPGAVKTELRWLLDRGKDVKGIAHALGVSSSGISPEKFTGSKEGEAAMLKSFTPQQRKTYDAAQADHQANAKKFLAIVRSPDGQQIIADARKNAALKKQPALAN